MAQEVIMVCMYRQQQTESAMLGAAPGASLLLCVSGALQQNCVVVQRQTAADVRYCEDEQVTGRP